MKYCTASLLLCLSSASAFSLTATGHQRANTSLQAVQESNAEISRTAFLSITSSAILSSLVIPSAYAEEDTTPSATKEVKSIKKCEVDDDCVSTANINDAKGSYR